MGEPKPDQQLVFIEVVEPRIDGQLSLEVGRAALQAAEFPASEEQ